MKKERLLALLICMLLLTFYFAGLDVKGPFPTIQYKLKGEQPLTAEFTMKDETKIIQNFFRFKLFPSGLVYIWDIAKGA